MAGSRQGANQEQGQVGFQLICLLSGLASWVYVLDFSSPLGLGPGQKALTCRHAYTLNLSDCSSVKTGNSRPLNSFSTPQLDQRRLKHRQGLFELMLPFRALSEDSYRKRIRSWCRNSAGCEQPGLQRGAKIGFGKRVARRLTGLYADPATP